MMTKIALNQHLKIEKYSRHITMSTQIVDLADKANEPTTKIDTMIFQKNIRNYNLSKTAYGQTSFARD